MIYTIGFTKSSAEHFFERLNENHIQVVLDIRLKTNSQLDGFAKAPDIEYFVQELTSAEYIHDVMFAPSRELLSAYRKGEINWEQYEEIFDALMQERNIDLYIQHHYPNIANRKYCLMCSEAEAQCCHRRLIAQRMARLFEQEIIHL